jgi:F-type H+-transporting ATPase subunit epsilon
MTKSKTLHCSVVTPEGSVFDGPSVNVVFPAFDGEMGILPNHAPLLTKLGAGELRVVEAGGEVRRWFVDGGFAQVVDNRLTVLTEQSRPVAELDRAEARVAMENAQAMPGGSPANIEARERALRSARAQLRLTS